MQIKPFMKTIEGLSENTNRAYEETLWLFDSFVNGAEPTESTLKKFLTNISPAPCIGTRQL